MKTNLYLSILKNFENLYGSKTNCDVIIQAGKGYDQKEIYAHSVVLRCQSDYFNVAFSSSWAKRKDAKYILEKSNISSYILEIIIRYLYCGKIDLNSMDTSDILKLLFAADKFGLITLCKYVKNYLIFDRLNEIFENASRNNSYAVYKDYCLEAICKEPFILFETDNILSLPAQIFEAILEREDLMMDEIDLWNNLIKWAHAQYPTLGKIPSEWTIGELILMKKLLLRFFPLMRFHNITFKNYYDKVVPYEKLFPKRLKFEIMKFHFTSNIKQIGLLPSRSICKLNTIIINSKYLTLFTDWINKNALEKVSYKFNLILRGSRDGFDPKTFHKKCDYKGATIVIAIIKGLNQIIGGYNPLDWSGNHGHKSSSNSFIFSFQNYNDINTGKIGRVLKKNYAVYCNISKGPCFGKLKLCGSNDLTMNFDGTWSSMTSTYPNLNIPKKFEVHDYEVFQIIKKRNK
ncbi:hypothetical protein RclHR1_00160043 [Rhizophagus clarus]|uniref:BTB/POZ domain-containing protein n=1 Tax=Rhizophagus clarus TaxID=94130 RepID=A0A2Z6QGR1_9GLOM|nr:hypothetical protein RclHR1_00160043 [Rhizophagus clarus]GES81069.1 BTB/POZ domain-containing protein [Rhizophagus clarus]